jgi:hypothetical protein
MEHVPATPGTPGTPGTTGTPGTPDIPGTPPQQLPGSWGEDPSHADPAFPNVPSGRSMLPPYLPDFAHGNRPTIGWDTTASVALREGIGASGYAGVGNSYSYELGHADFPPSATIPLRIALGLYKIFNDVITASPVSGIRDAVGLVGGVVNEATGGLVDELVNWTIPIEGGGA